MENASKALLIAGGMLIALMVLGTFMYFYNNLSSYRQEEEDLIAQRQAADFNKEFEDYNRNLYGSELLSLANRIVDYNKREGDNKGYTKIELSVKITKDLNILSDNEFFNQSSYNTAIDLVEKYDNLSKKIKNQSEINITSVDGVTKTISQWYKSNLSQKQLDDKLLQNSERIDDYKKLLNEQTGFARKTFKCTNVAYDNNGRVNKMVYTEN